VKGAVPAKGKVPATHEWQSNCDVFEQVRQDGSQVIASHSDVTELNKVFKLQVTQLFISGPSQVLQLVSQT
jgi:hypothetical protein